jgi:uroporphyrinogen-III synthase
MAVVCIGPGTALAARDAGLEVSAVAAERATAAVVAALEEWFGRDANVEKR